MKKILSVIILFITAFSASAQKKDTSIVDVYQGAFIYMYAGPIFNSSAGLNKSLNEANVFGLKGYNVISDANVGANVGLGGMMLFDRGILIGANAGYSYLNGSGNGFAKVTLSSASVLIDFGKVIYNRNNLVIYPFIGVGLNKYFLNIKNTNDTAIVRYNALKPLYKGQAQTYVANSALFEIGVSLKKTYSQKYVFGLDFGAYFSSTSQGSWKDKGEFVQFREAPNVNGGYVRLTFQLAKFKHRITDLDTVFYSSLAPADTARKTRFGRLVEESPADRATRDSAFARKERDRAAKIKGIRSTKEENAAATTTKDANGKDKAQQGIAESPADTSTKDIVKVKRMRIYKEEEQKPGSQGKKSGSKKKIGTTKTQKIENPNNLLFNFTPVEPVKKEEPAKKDISAAPKPVVQPVDTTKIVPPALADTTSKKPITPPKTAGEQNKKPKITTKKNNTMYNTLKSVLEKELAEIKEAGLYKNERIIITPQGADIKVSTGQEVTNFCANNYLGLSSHPKVLEAAKKAIDTHGYGMSSVRFICGTQDIHKTLEAKIAEFLGTEDTILYAAAFDANGGVFEPLFNEQDAIISDALNHASIIDGVRLCKAERHRYTNSDLVELEEKLKATQHCRHRIIVTDGVFSMDGTIAQLDKICDLADKYNALVMVDESHSTGFMGKTGRGTHELNNVMGRIDIITGTLGKALGGALGGFTTGRKEIIEMLRQRSRPYLFSNSLAPSIVGAAIAVIDMLSETTTLRDKLEANTGYFREKMTAAGFDIKLGTHPIVPIMLYDAKLSQDFAAKLLDEGIYVIGFYFPVVPKGQARIRVQISAGHERHHLDKAITAFTKVGKELGVLKPMNA